MARLCWKCETVGDPLWKALADLRAKIRILEIQRNEKTENMDITPSSHITNDNNNSQDPLIFATSNHCAVNISMDDRQEPVCSNSNNNDLEEITCEMEKNLASDALKMAEKRCTLLENQLSAMKRLFLRKIAKKSEAETIKPSNDDIQDIRRAKNNYLKDSFIETKIIPDTESLQSFNLDAIGSLSSENESETFNLPLDDIDLKQIQRNDYQTVLEDSYKARIGKNLYDTRTNKSCKFMPHRQREQPFILGCSTSNSYNSNVMKNKFNRKVSPKDPYQLLKNVGSNNDRKVVESSVNNLRSIYSDLCSEYDFLLNKKAKILDSLGRLKGRDLLDQRQYLNEVTQTLPLKRDQINKIKNMINTFTESKTNYPKIRWDI